MLTGVPVDTVSEFAFDRPDGTALSDARDGPWDRRSWPEKAETRSAIFERIEVFYNRIRIHMTIGSYAPEEFESLRLSGSKEAA